eukprot:scaffold15035_cov59-Attheya_sp.AAC.2
MLNSPPSDTIDPVHSIVQGAPTHTTHDPHVAVDTPLGSRANHYRPSKPTTMATAVANQQQQPTLLRDPMPDQMPPTIAAVPQFMSVAQTYTPPEPTEAIAMQLGTRANQYRPSKPTSLATAVASN